MAQSTMATVTGNKKSPPLITVGLASIGFKNLQSILRKALARKAAICSRFTLAVGQ